MVEIQTMPAIQKYIFNRKLLQRTLERVEVAHIENFEQKKAILTNWKHAIESSTLQKAGEVAIHGDFLIDIFCRVLGYKRQIEHPAEWNLTHEQKTKTDATKADGALGFFRPDHQDIRVVIELKDITTDLDAKQHRKNDKRTPIEQAFSYVHKSGKRCKWVVVSNYQELRLYHADSSGEYEHFVVANLTDDAEFKRFYFLLSASNVLAKEGESTVDALYRSNEAEQENISKAFYSRYKQARHHLFEHIKEKNPTIDELSLLEKSQKLLDRFIFVCFCEDTRLLPQNIFREVVKHAKQSFSFTENKIWTELQGLFHAIDQGYPARGINAFNGGLFQKDPLLDSLSIEDGIFEELASITDYDFDSDLSVNILGHIFEQSISDLEDFRAAIQGEEIDRKQGKRKKDGIFYTPEYITRYIVEKAVGGWLEEQKQTLGIENLSELKENDYASIKRTKTGFRYNKQVEQHINFWENYKTRLMNIKVLDPACGSGAFLNQAFDFLYREGQTVNEMLASFRQGQTEIFDLDKHILSNNLYGVDLNNESVEITKLSLWLKTANKKSPLTALDNNIKSGNSLISEPVLAGKKAFRWEDEFPHIVSDGGFDVILGNPPYGAALTFAEKDLFKRIYANVHSRMPDTFNYFVSKSLATLKANGYLSFIVPNTLLYQNEYEKARGLLLGSNKVLTVINLGDKIFEDAHIPTCIFLVTKQKEAEYSFEYGDLRHEERERVALSLKNDLGIFTKSNILATPAFIFGVNQQEFSILEKVKQCSLTVDSIAEEVANGIQPSGDKIFRITYEFAAQHQFEKALLRSVLVGGDFNRYTLTDPQKYVIYTTKHVNIEHFPNIKAYLSLHKETLSKKRETRKGILPWWCLHWPRYEKLFEEPKIVIRQTADRIIATYDEERFYAMNNVIILKTKAELSLSYKFILACLNSTLNNFVYRNITQETKRAFAEVKPKNVRKLFIPDISLAQQQPFIEATDTMMQLQKGFQEETEKFRHFIQSSYAPKKLSDKLEQFYLLSFTEFVSELKKQKVSLSKKDEFELMDLFEEQKTNALGTKQTIEDTNKEIDLMLYKLYDLKGEEIDLVESL